MLALSPSNNFGGRKKKRKREKGGGGGKGRGKGKRRDVGREREEREKASNNREIVHLQSSLQVNNYVILWGNFKSDSSSSCPFTAAAKSITRKLLRGQSTTGLRS